ncbi:efflux RND transporter periplasmic adaptor subunit [Microbaculum marinum]|uniref:Efflux RND transporter periplasmic adaptor subunit n=1 Tax=Microbaculum marinum TaxID=1764581 RepID=A0AAW9RN52_9HYPH
MGLWTNRAGAGCLGLTVAMCFAGVATAQDSKQGSSQSDKPAAPAVVVEAVRNQEITKSTQFVGRVQAIQQTDLKARVEGFLESVEFKEGAMVKSGEQLYQIETGPYEAALAGAQASLASGKASLAGTQARLQDADLTLERQTTLLKSNTVSQAAVDKAQADRDQAYADVQNSQAQIAEANAQIQTAQLNLSYTKVISPIDGRIGKTNYTLGNLVGPSSGTLSTVVQMDPMRVVFSISDRDYVNVVESVQGGAPADASDGTGAQNAATAPSGAADASGSGSAGSAAAGTESPTSGTSGSDASSAASSGSSTAAAGTGGADADGTAEGSAAPAPATSAPATSAPATSDDTASAGASTATTATADTADGAAGTDAASSEAPVAETKGGTPVAPDQDVNKALAAEAAAMDTPNTDVRNDFVPTLILPNGQPYSDKGKISFIDNEVDPNTGTIAVYADFPNKQFVLVPGQFVTVNVAVGEAKSMPVVPAGAVLQDKQGPYVLVVDKDNRAQIQRIETAEKMQTGWAVSAGLTQGQIIIVDGIQKVQPGMVVNPQTAKPAS